MKQDMNREKTTRGIRATRALPADNHPTSLPCQMPFLYGRMSSVAQVKGSEKLSSQLRRKHGRAETNEVT